MISTPSRVARAIAPVRVAAGEHVPNRVVFKNYFLYGGIHFVQADCTRLAGVNEFLAVSLMAKKFQLPIVPHVGDMGQIHQHLVLFNHVALNHEAYFLEHIPHLQEHFLFPAQLSGGLYKPPQEPGASADLRFTAEDRYLSKKFYGCINLIFVAGLTGDCMLPLKFVEIGVGRTPGSSLAWFHWSFFPGLLR
jgi:L-alanine-DL-glutamate epimerase-like enolase superfamily enzyme